MKESIILDNIKKKLHISELNQMQRTILSKYPELKGDLILFSPTGSGKTLAFLIPLFKSINKSTSKVQAIIIAPSRELVIQIDNIAKMISDNIKITCCYGGHNVLDEKNSLEKTPDVIISTPGRLLDHINRKNIFVRDTKYLILDEFDKALELGFHDEMKKICNNLPNLSKRILTSATRLNEFPEFLKLNNHYTIDFLYKNEELSHRLTVSEIKSPEKDKLSTLLLLLKNINSNSRIIVFINYRDAGIRIYDYLRDNNIPTGIYNGSLEQIEREKAIEMFNNGSFKVLVSTDLGSRGLDIDSVEHIIHYHMPLSEGTYTHRNGRSARVDASGNIYVITAPNEKIPEYITFDNEINLDRNSHSVLIADYNTLYFNAGKREKISKGDIVGFLINKGELSKDDIGTINSHDHYTLAAVKVTKFKSTLKKISSEKIKNQKIKITTATQRIKDSK